MVNRDDSSILIIITEDAFSSIISCLNCKYCNNKQYNLCTDVRDIGSTVDGGFAKFTKIPEEILQIGDIIPTSSWPY